MTSFTRLAGAAVFLAAALAQPLALDACSVSCEAARAARQPAVAAPCHHTTSCATQISQAPSPGSRPAVHAALPSVVVIEISRPGPAVALWRAVDAVPSSSPPIHTQLRL